MVLIPMDRSQGGVVPLRATITIAAIDCCCLVCSFAEYDFEWPWRRGECVLHLVQSNGPVFSWTELHVIFGHEARNDCTHLH